MRSPTRQYSNASRPGVASNTPSRRMFLAATAAASIASAAPSLARAAVPHVSMHGAFEIIVVSDGHLVVPAQRLATNADRNDLEAVLAAAGQHGEWIAPATNVTLIRTGTDVILIDTGAGPHYMPTAGKLLANMEAAGLQRESITKVIFTHAHPDHIWGTLDDFDQSPNFPNASYVIAAAEWNFWMAEDVVAKLPEDRQNFASGAKRNLSSIKERVRTVQPGEDIAPGLRAVDTSGHTAGHIAIEVVSGENALLVVGDALTHPIISFAHPNWRPAADHHDAQQAIATRKRLLDRLAADRSLLIGYHLPAPGIGRVERRGTTYAFVSGR